MKSSFIRLINLYTAVLTITVIVATALFAWSSVRNYNSELSQAETTVITQLSESIAQNQQVATQFATQLVDNPDTIQNINKYFSTSLTKYSDYATDATIASGKYFFWPNEVRTFLMQHENINKLTLRLADQKQVFVATQDNPGGKLVSSKSKLAHDPLAVTAPLINQYTLETDGVVGIMFSQRELKKRFAQLTTIRPMQILMRTDQNEPAFYFAGEHVPVSEQRIIKKAANQKRLDDLHAYQIIKKVLPAGSTILMVVNRAKFFQLTFLQILPSMLFGLILLLLLSGGLRLTFRHYQKQLGTIVDTVATFSKGNLDARVAIIPQNTDLQVLAVGINNMLDEIHNHVYTIYQLKIANQSANIRALQAQINPHFLSNTLEYIRMAAIDANQPELANVVYNFAALLRNNTDFSPQSTLKDELSFVEKYVFLYQVRFPDRLAYQIKTDPSVASVRLPKFTLQPIVENYFVHGVDFRHTDNALSIKSWRDGAQINILVKNNGRPLTLEQLQKINSEMRDPNNVEERTSIGLQNVYLRMKDYFGDSFGMSIDSDGKQGVELRICFKDEVNGEDAESHDR